MLAKIRNAVLGKPREDTLEYMPKERYDDWIPKVKVRRQVTSKGQVTIPADKRVPDYGSSVQPGDTFLVHAFPPDYDGFYDYAKYDASLTQSHRITIPKCYREEYDIRPGDTVALHLYRRFED